MKNITLQPSQEATTALEQLAGKKTQLPKASAEGAGPGPPLPSRARRGARPTGLHPTRSGPEPRRRPGPARGHREGAYSPTDGSPEAKIQRVPHARLQRHLPRSKSRAGGPGFILRPAPPLATRDGGRAPGTPSLQAERCPWRLPPVATSGAREARSAGLGGAAWVWDPGKPVAKMRPAPGRALGFLQTAVWNRAKPFVLKIELFFKMETMILDFYQITCKVL